METATKNWRMAISSKQFRNGASVIWYPSNQTTIEDDGCYNLEKKKNTEV